MSNTQKIANELGMAFRNSIFGILFKKKKYYIISPKGNIIEKIQPVKVPPCYRIPRTCKQHHFSHQKGKHSFEIGVINDVRNHVVSMKSILYCIACFFLYYSCEKIENLALPGPTMIGTWEETEPDGISQFEGSTWTSLKLNDDLTFQIIHTAWTDMRVIGDPCNSVTDYYAKGTYSTTGDSISFHGCWSDSVHSSCVGRCDGELNFNETYKYSLFQDNLVLDPEGNEMTRRVMIPYRG